jgi:cyclic pyranopterin phosphate synthase
MNPERTEGAYREIVGMSAHSTHLRPQGGVHMVSISAKEATQRRAIAECWIGMSEIAFARLVSESGPKGDVLGTARLAGIMATKRTSDLIPLCHPLALQHVEVDFAPVAAIFKVRVTCAVEVEGKTGVEMEAMVGANVAALTIYDMLKSIDRTMEIGPCRLLKKSGGRSGTFERSESSTETDNT